jgi:hypothetical protein
MDITSRWKHQIFVKAPGRGNYAHSEVRIRNGPLEVEPGADIEIFEI